MEKTEDVSLISEGDLEKALKNALDLFEPDIRSFAITRGFRTFNSRIQFLLLLEGLVYNRDQHPDFPTKETLGKYDQLKEKAKYIAKDSKEYERVISYVTKVLGI